MFTAKPVSFCAIYSIEYFSDRFLENSLIPARSNRFPPLQAFCFLILQKKIKFNSVAFLFQSYFFFESVFNKRNSRVSVLTLINIHVLF